MIQFHQITTDPVGSGQSTGASCNSPARSRQSRSVPIWSASVPIWSTVPQQRPAVHPAAAQSAERQPVPNQLSTSEPISTTGTVCCSEPVWTNSVWTKPVWPKPIWAKPIFFSEPIWSKPIWSEAKRGNRGLFGGRAGGDAGLGPHWEEEAAEKRDNDARTGILKKCKFCEKYKCNDKYNAGNKAYAESGPC